MFLRPDRPSLHYISREGRAQQCLATFRLFRSQRTTVADWRTPRSDRLAHGPITNRVGTTHGSLFDAGSSKSTLVQREQEEGGGKPRGYFFRENRAGN